MLEPNLMQNIVYNVIPAYIGSLIGVILGLLLSKLNLPYILIEILPWRAGVGLLVTWFGFIGVPLANLFGLGATGAIVASLGFALLITFPVVLTISLEDSTKQRAISIARGATIGVITFMVVHLSYRIGAGGIGNKIIMNTTLGTETSGHSAMVQLASLLIIVDILSGALQAWLKNAPIATPEEPVS